MDDANDAVTEIAGAGSRDILFASVDYVLAAGTDIDVLRVAVNTGISLEDNGLANSLVGAVGADTLEGGGGNDTLDGGSGADSLAGGANADTYRVDDAGDIVTELGGGGTDRVFAGADYTLTAGAEIEALRASVGTGLRLAGNGLANTIVGAAGTDTVDGGDGIDRLTGGAGADAFSFSTAPGAGNVDVVNDFSVANDVFLLDDAVFQDLATLPGNTLDDSEFVVGTAAQNTDQHIIYDAAAGKLYYDADGSGGDTAVLFANLAKNLTLTHEDFMVA